MNTFRVCVAIGTVLATQVATATDTFKPIDVLSHIATVERYTRNPAELAWLTSFAPDHIKKLEESTHYLLTFKQSEKPVGVIGSLHELLVANNYSSLSKNNNVLETLRIDAVGHIKELSDKNESRLLSSIYSDYFKLDRSGKSKKFYDACTDTVICFSTLVDSIRKAPDFANTIENLPAALRFRFNPIVLSGVYPTLDSAAAIMNVVESRFPSADNPPTFMSGDEIIEISTTGSAVVKVASWDDVRLFLNKESPRFVLLKVIRGDKTFTSEIAVRILDKQ